ncbi:flippase [Sutcliffiella horikoshii]|uniref:flippase n=1 Tax=Sutcliffiella horikoshii TaxID=79883 RepID=UPI0012F80E38|nr:flippase [Sutcliffiella horikoshii]
MGTRVIVLFGSFIVSIILARLLGPEGKGIITAIFVLPNLLISIADLGIKQSTAYYIGKKIYRVEEMLPSIIILWIVSSGISILIGISYFLTGPDKLYGWNLLLIVLLTIPLNLLNQYLSGILLGKEKIGVFNTKIIISFVINFLGVLILVWWFKMGVLGAVIVQIFISLCTIIYILWHVKKLINFRTIVKRKITNLIVKRGFSFALALFIISLNYRIDIIFLERLTSSAEVGVYSIGVSISELIWQLPAAIGLVIFSKNVNAKTDEIAYLRAIKLLRISLPFLILGSLMIWLLAPQIINLLFGKEFSAASEVIRLLLPGVLSIVIVKILHPDLAARGYPLFALKILIFPLITNVILNLILIPSLGIEGAAIASTISYLIGGFLFAWVYARKESISLRDVLIINKNDIKLLSSYIKLKK